MLGPSACTLGPVAYSVGMLRLLQDRPAEAAASFELAIERSRTMRARPYEARSQAGLAAALRRPATRARRGARGAAAATARELGMVRLERELALASAAACGRDRVFAGFSQGRSRTLAASPPTVPKGPLT